MRKCKICGFEGSGGITEHHLRPTSQGGDNSLENKVDLCMICHEDVHRYFGNRELALIFCLFPVLVTELAIRKRNGYCGSKRESAEDAVEALKRAESEGRLRRPWNTYLNEEQRWYLAGCPGLNFIIDKV